jgi:ATP-binding cassette subfamily B multidrug efflux pump
MLFNHMQYRLNRRFVPWLVAHSFEFWYYYLGATICLYLLHYYQSEIPELAKGLGDMVSDGKLSEVDIKYFFLLAASILFFRTFSRLLFFYPARVQQKNLRLELISKIENAAPENYIDHNDGQLFQTIYNDLNRIRGFVGFALLQLGNIIIAASIFIPKIRQFNPDFLIAFSPMVACIALFTVLIYFVQPLMVRAMDQAGEVQNFLIESYDAKKTIKNFHSEREFLKLFQKYSADELYTFFQFTAARNVAFPLIRVGIGVSLIWGALIVYDQNLPGTALIFFSGFLYLILEPLMLLSWIGVVTSQGYASWTRIKKLINDIDKDVQYKIEYDQSALCPRVEFWDQKLNFEIKPAAWNVFVGDTGSGKSYLLENLATLYKKEGMTYSYIHQEPYLYNDTILNNIFLGQSKSQEKLQRVKSYIKMFALDSLAESIDAILELEVGENGKKLSGGQAKRVALIRSLVCDVDYILWDDPFSSVDLILEKQIIEKIKKDKNVFNKTFIMTSHRLTTVKSCDWVIFIEKDSAQADMGEVRVELSKESKLSEYFAKQLV